MGNYNQHEDCSRRNADELHGDYEDDDFYENLPGEAYDWPRPLTLRVSRKLYTHNADHTYRVVGGWKTDRVCQNTVLDFHGNEVCRCVDGHKINNSVECDAHTVGELRCAHYAAPGYGQNIWCVARIDERGVWGYTVEDTGGIYEPWETE